MTPNELLAISAESLPNRPLVVALGGGADSAVAAWLASRSHIARAVFVRHGLEGSVRLERSAVVLCAELGIPIACVDAPVQSGPSLEARARNARWAAISEALEADEVVVTGHTLDDQAETVLMNILRGAGAAGVAGMEAGRSDVFRPLLGITREDVRAVANQLGLSFSDDPANESPAHLRNRIRHQLMPHIEAEYRREVRRTLARTGALAAADDAVIKNLSAGIRILDEGDAVSIPTALIATVPQPVAARAVRRGLRILLDPYPGTRADVDGVLAVARGDVETANVSGGFTARREGPMVVVAAGDAPAPDASAVLVPSSVAFGAMTIGFSAVVKPRVHRRSTLFADPASIREAAVLRPAGTGDRIDIGKGAKSLRSVLAEHGVPVRLRTAWPVVATDARIIAVVGVRVASWARAVTSDAIAITVERNQP